MGHPTTAVAQFLHPSPRLAEDMALIATVIGGIASIETPDMRWLLEREALLDRLCAETDAENAAEREKYCG